MNFFKVFITLCSIVFLSNNSFSQRAKDGDYTASTAGNVVNTYTFLTADAAASASSITVSNNSMIGGVFGGALAAGGFNINYSDARC